MSLIFSFSSSKEKERFMRRQQLWKKDKKIWNKSVSGERKGNGKKEEAAGKRQ